MMHHFYHSSGRPHHRCGLRHPVISGPDSFPKKSNRQLVLVGVVTTSTYIVHTLGRCKTLELMISMQLGLWFRYDSFTGHVQRRPPNVKKQSRPPLALGLGIPPVTTGIVHMSNRVGSSLTMIKSYYICFMQAPTSILFESDFS